MHCPYPVTCCYSDTWHFNNSFLLRHFLFSLHYHSWVESPNTVHYCTHQLTLSYTVTLAFSNELVWHLPHQAGLLSRTGYALITLSPLLWITWPCHAVSFPHSHNALSLPQLPAVTATLDTSIILFFVRHFLLSLHYWVTSGEPKHSPLLHTPAYSFIHSHAGIL